MPRPGALIAGVLGAKWDVLQTMKPTANFYPLNIEHALAHVILKIYKISKRVLFFMDIDQSPAGLILKGLRDSGAIFIH
jgi:hypothetical protein